ncbi:hypothetical protein [Pendulispora albinea]|uniref:Uncharacterized protein n=1 Tax=Pendulispora albinea TaxID=2741071 RepID=A0ABZ2LNU2_9BACT
MSTRRVRIRNGLDVGKAVVLTAVMSVFGAVACAADGADGTESTTEEAMNEMLLDVESDDGELGAACHVPKTCAGIESAMKKWVAKHRSCGDGLPSCEYIPDLDYVNLCEIVAAKKKDRKKLDALLKAFKDKGCTTTGVCGHTPGSAVCENGTCQWKRDTSCEDCPRDLDPQCTVNNLNALNKCYAEHCLKSPVAHAGFCEDSAECKGAQGTCEEWTSNETAFCPDGTRWHGAFWTPEATKGCAEGNFQNTCCVPWDQPCSYIGSTVSLNIDPFTCATPTGGGMPWVCVDANDTSTCTMAAKMQQPLNPNGPYNADITMISHLGNMAEITGVHRETGAHFRCTGKVSYDISRANTWNCETCQNGACTQCQAQQTYLCSL